MIFDVPTMISFISQVVTLLPGDAIFTGTCEGVGPMEDGDTVEIEILANRRAAQSGDAGGGIRQGSTTALWATVRAMKRGFP